jgi:hypothetical protein
MVRIYSCVTPSCTFSLSLLPDHQHSVARHSKLSHSSITTLKLSHHSCFLDIAQLQSPYFLTTLAPLRLVHSSLHSSITTSSDHGNTHGSTIPSHQIIAVVCFGNSKTFDTSLRGEENSPVQHRHSVTEAAMEATDATESGLPTKKRRGDGKELVLSESSSSMMKIH